MVGDGFCVSLDLGIYFVHFQLRLQLDLNHLVKDLS